MTTFSDFTPRLGLPYLLPDQAQKHVTLNESLSRLDSLVMASISGVGSNIPPEPVSPGQSWLVGSAPEEAWEGQAGQFATFLDGAWAFQTPRAGWVVWDEAVGQLRVYDGQSWRTLPLSATAPVFHDVDQFGLAATPTAEVPFIVRANQALFMAREETTGGQGDLRISLNKPSPSDTASLVFQSDWSGRAEIGLTGDNRLSLKVSSDGTTWHQGLCLDAGAGWLKTGFHVVPATAGDRDIGQPTQPFRDLYLMRAPSVGSDARAKRDVTPLDADQVLALVTNLQPVSFRYKQGAHLHFGFTAQQVRTALDQIGQEDTFLWRLADPDQADSPQLICQEELIAVLVCALQDLLTRITRLEGPQHAVRHGQGGR
ncbi:MAG: DUF2793 domain-containing protein [Henriciella sp.]